ncbi:MAG: hypothetical protein NTV79_03050 [Candidatus Aureabacteria bacterium]|nr:hypothetical protein [Candidatus Auribacterota bacterium]
MKNNKTKSTKTAALALLVVLCGLPPGALAQSGMTGEPTPPADPLSVEIVGPLSATVNCDPLIYRAEISGGTEPYTVIWNPAGNGTQMWCIFRSEGGQTVYCRVLDSSVPKMSVTETQQVEVAPRDEVGEPQTMEEYGSSERQSDEIGGDPTGQPVTVCVSKNIESNTVLNVSIPFPISILEAKVGYSHNEKITLQATYCYSPIIPEGKQASVWVQPVQIVTTGELARRNCMGTYETGTYSGKKLDHLLYELKITDID